MILARVTLPFGTLALAAIYGGIGALCFFLWEKTIGPALCAASLLLLAHYLEFIGYRPKTIINEAILVLGMFASGWFGPSGGHINWRDIVGAGGRDSDLVGRQDIPQARMAAHHESDTS